MATRSRRTSGARKSSATPEAGTAAPARNESAEAASAAAQKNAIDSLTTLAQAQLRLQVDSALATLRSTQAVREAQLQANLQAQARHEEVARELDSLHSINDIAALQLSLVRDNVQGMVSLWSRMAELAGGSAVESWARAADGWSKLGASLVNANLQWTRLGPLETPAAVEELEASVDHLVSPAIASPMLWPAQEAAREAMTFATSALNDWFTWSGQFANGGERDTVH